MSARERVALVTGAARGIGAAIAARLAAEGHPVVLADVLEEVEGTAAALRTGGHEAQAIRLDVADEAQVAGLPHLLGAWWERLGVVVNNAGISPKLQGRARRVRDMPAEEWRRVLEVNLTGAFLVSRACIPPLGRAGSPDEVAAVVAFLASDSASYLNGATIDVGGGSFMP